MTTEEQRHFIKSVLFEFRDGVEDLDDAIKAIMEVITPKATTESDVAYIHRRSREIASDPEKALEYLKEIGSAK